MSVEPISTKVFPANDQQAATAAERRDAWGHAYTRASRIIEEVDHFATVWADALSHRARRRATNETQILGLLRAAHERFVTSLVQLGAAIEDLEDNGGILAPVVQLTAYQQLDAWRDLIESLDTQMCRISRMTALRFG
jgi:hypothetical protein